ncbi:MAG: hypothetical protein HS122_01795 [Opitutaceae bacterium]|nr:hypothetical protein [Opitutaceae bacterium]
MILSDSTLRLGKLIDAANRALIETKIKSIENYISESDNGNAQLEQELRSWRRALERWKPGDPIPRGIAYVVIAEEGGEFCVAYYPWLEPPFVFYIDKENYKSHSRALERQMKATILGAVGEIIP